MRDDTGQPGHRAVLSCPELAGAPSAPPRARHGHDERARRFPGRNGIAASCCDFAVACDQRPGAPLPCERPGELETLKSVHVLLGTSRACGPNHLIFVFSHTIRGRMHAGNPQEASQDPPCTTRRPWSVYVHVVAPAQGLA